MIEQRKTNHRENVQIEQEPEVPPSVCKDTGREIRGQEEKETSLMSFMKVFEIHLNWYEHKGGKSHGNHQSDSPFMSEFSRSSYSQGKE